MRGLQAILTALVLTGGIAMLLQMIFWPTQEVFGLAAAGVIIAAFALMAYGDMKAAARNRDDSKPGPGEPI